MIDIYSQKPKARFKYTMDLPWHDMYVPADAKGVILHAAIMYVRTCISLYVHFIANVRIINVRVSLGSHDTHNDEFRS